MEMSLNKLNYFRDRLFDERQDNKYIKRFRNIYYLIYDFMLENKINLCSFFPDDGLDFMLYSDPYESCEYIFTILTMSLYSCLQVTTDTEYQQQIPIDFMTNLVLIIKSKPKPSSFISNFDRIKMVFKNKTSTDKAPYHIKLIKEFISNTKEITFDQSQELIHKLMNDTFGGCTNDDCNNWYSMGFHAFLLSINNFDNREELVQNYLNCLIHFEIIINKFSSFSNTNFMASFNY